MFRGERAQNVKSRMQMTAGDQKTWLLLGFAYFGPKSVS